MNAPTFWIRPFQGQGDAKQRSEHAMERYRATERTPLGKFGPQTGQMGQTSPFKLLSNTNTQ